DPGIDVEPDLRDRGDAHRDRNRRGSSRVRPGRKEARAGADERDQPEAQMMPTLHLPASSPELPVTSRRGRGLPSSAVTALAPRAQRPRPRRCRPACEVMTDTAESADARTEEEDENEQSLTQLFEQLGREVSALLLYETRLAAARHKPQVSR